jgi:hypothetical protein
MSLVRNSTPPALPALFLTRLANGVTSSLKIASTEAIPKPGVGLSVMVVDVDASPGVSSSY